MTGARSRRFLPGPRGVSGYGLGVLHIDSPVPYIAGNIQNATTLPFPVAYECAAGVTVADLLSADPSVEAALVAAAHRLVARGVRAIVGACGSFAAFQDALTRAVAVPVYASILVQVPFLLSALPIGRKLAIVFADRRSFVARMREQVGSPTDAQLVITDCMGLAPFRALLTPPHELDDAALEDALVEHLSDLIKQHPEVGTIMLQCSELPPYAAAIQAATNRPIVDVTTLANWVHSGLVRRPFIDLE